MSGTTLLKPLNSSKRDWRSPIRKMACCLSFLLWLALLQTSLAVNVPGPNGTVVTQILSATSSNSEVKVVEDRDLGKILVYPPQPKEFTVKIIARIMYPDDQYLEKISTVMVGGAGVTIESSEIRNSLILATLKVAPGASGGRFSITYENEDNPNHKGCNVRLLPVELRDVNGSGDADDVTITPWDTSQDIANNNIAWIDAHQSAQNAAPRMPQLEFRVPGLPEGLTIEAKLVVKYERGNGARHPSRTNKDGNKDTVNIPENGDFVQVNGDTWQLYNEVDWQTELTERGFFGGEATLTYQIKQAGNVVVGPEEIDFRIGGENPDDARCRTYIGSRPNAGLDGNLWFAYAIAKSESRDYNGGGSRYNQFLELPNHRRDVGRPLFGDDRDSDGNPHGPGGYGMFQNTGNANNPRADISRRQFWNWQDNVNAAMLILSSKRAIADRWMNNESLRPGTNIPDGQRPQARRDRGVNLPVPNRTVRGILFSDDANSDRVGPIEDAVTIKAYNSATTHYCSWGGNTAGWRFNNTNGRGFDYVDRVCQEVENDE